jgi:hypothetical protein
MSSSYNWFLCCHVSFFSEETVDVGGDLYEIDTDAAAAIISETAASDAEVSAVAPKEASAVSVASTSELTWSHRTPSIHFLGKEGWAIVKSSGAGGIENSHVSGAVDQAEAIVPVVVLHPMFGRPAFTEAEMEALVTGGASIAPKLVLHSSGAKFKM